MVTAKRRGTRRSRRFVAAVTTAILLLGSAALADSLSMDGDTMKAGDNLRYTTAATGTGNACTTRGTAVTGQAVISRTGANPSLSSGELVTLTLSSPNDGITVSGPHQANVPSTWSGGASFSISFTTTVNAAVPDGDYTVSAVAVGAQSGARLNDSFTVIVSCGPASVAPTVGYTLTPSTPDGDNGWYKSDVTLVWNITGTPTPTEDSGCVDQTIIADQAASTYECAVTNSAGSDSASVTIKRDATAPTVAYTSADDGSGNGPNADGWYKAAVTATFTATDAIPGSGFSGGETKTDTASSGASEGSSVSITSPAFTDLAGNTAAAGAASQTFMIDLTDPYYVAFVGGPAAGASYVWGSVPAAPTCTAEDDVSGLDTCVVTGYATSVGSHTMTATATDNAGRSATETRSYTVLAWDLAGFGSPVSTTANDAEPGDYIWNVMKGGRTVPLKFEVFAGTTELTATSAIDSFKAFRTACPGGAAATGELDFILDAETTAGNTQLRYDATEGQFIQNWKTAKVSEDTCYRVELRTDDGSFLQAFFKLTK